MSWLRVLEDSKLSGIAALQHPDLQGEGMERWNQRWRHEPGHENTGISLGSLDFPVWQWKCMLAPLMQWDSVQSLSRVRLFKTPWIAARQASLSITNSQSLLRLMCIESVMPSNHFICCHPLLFLPSIFPSIRVFSSESVLPIRYPKYWGFSFSISPSNEYSGLISFRMDWLDLLAVQGTLKSLLQHPFQKHQFFSTQLSL